MITCVSLGVANTPAVNLRLNRSWRAHSWGIEKESELSRDS